MQFFICHNNTIMQLYFIDTSIEYFYSSTNFSAYRMIPLSVWTKKSIGSALLAIVLTVSVVSGSSLVYGSFESTPKKINFTGTVDCGTDDPEDCPGYLSILTSGTRPISVQLTEKTKYVNGTPEWGDEVEVKAVASEGDYVGKVVRITQKYGAGAAGDYGDPGNKLKIKRGTVVEKADRSMIVQFGSEYYAATVIITNQTAFIGKVKSFAEVNANDIVKVWGKDKPRGFIADKVEVKKASAAHTPTPSASPTTDAEPTTVPSPTAETSPTNNPSPTTSPEGSPVNTVSPTAEPSVSATPNPETAPTASPVSSQPAVSGGGSGGSGGSRNTCAKPPVFSEISPVKKGVYKTMPAIRFAVSGEAKRIAVKVDGETLDLDEEKLPDGRILVTADTTGVGDDSGKVWLDLSASGERPNCVKRATYSITVDAQATETAEEETAEEDDFEVDADGTLFSDPEDALTLLQERGLVSKFSSPERQLTRGNTARIIAAVLKLEAENQEEKSGFPDVPKNRSYAPFIRLLKDRGVLNGYGDGLFRPGKLITRAEAFKIVYRAAGASLTSAELTCADVETGAWYLPFLEAGTADGLIKAGEGCRPHDQITEAEFAQLVVRLFGIN